MKNHAPFSIILISSGAPARP